MKQVKEGKKLIGLNLEEDEMFLFAVTIDRENYLKMVQPNAEFTIFLNTSDKFERDASKETLDKVSKLNKEFTEVIRGHVIERTIELLRNQGYTEEQINEVYQSN